MPAGGEGGLAGAYFIANKMGHISPGSNRTLNWGIYNTVSATVLAERVPSLSTRQPMAHQLERAEKALLDKLAISQLTKPLIDAVLATPKAYRDASLVAKHAVRHELVRGQRSQLTHGKPVAPAPDYKDKQYSPCDN